MRLRSRVFLLVASAALISGLAAFFAVSHLLTESFLALERDGARVEAVRARDLLLSNTAGLASSNADWANWDDLHDAMAGDAGAFAAEYLVPRTTRSFAGLEALVAAIDRISLERQTPATMSVWRAALDALHGPQQQRLL